MLCYVKVSGTAYLELLVQLILPDQADLDCSTVSLPAVRAVQGGYDWPLENSENSYHSQYMTIMHYILP